MDRASRRAKSPAVQGLWTGGRVYAVMLVLLAAAVWWLPLGVESGLAVVWGAAAVVVLASGRSAYLGSYRGTIALVFLAPGLTLGAVLYWMAGRLTGWPGITMYAIVVAGSVYMSVLAARVVWELRRR